MNDLLYNGSSDAGVIPERAIMSFTDAKSLSDTLDEQRDELLLVLAEEDCHLREGKYLRKLILKRLEEIEQTRIDLGLPESDVAECAVTRDDLLEDLSRQW